MNRPAVVILRKELRDVLRNRLLLLLVAGLGTVIVLSVIVAAAAFHTKVLDYQKYLNAMTSAGMAGNVTEPQLFALQLLRGAVEYLEIIGAIVAIVIGYGMAAKEKNRGTLRLLFSRPVGALSVALGKLLALAVIWLAVIVALAVVMVMSIRIVGGTGLSSPESVKLAIALGLAWLYLSMWSALSFGLAGMTRQLSTALVVGLMLWLGFVLIIPQIGDTMDPDNQVPGGLFKALQIDKPQEKAVMAHFSGYETTRNLLESTSISKRFERATFAFLGVKDKFNGKPLGVIWSGMWSNIVWLTIGSVIAAGLALTQNKKRNLLRRD